MAFYSKEYLAAATPEVVGRISTSDLLAFRNHLAQSDFMEGWQIKLVCSTIAVAVPPE